MGLPEQRALKAFRDFAFPRLQRAIHAAAGFDVPITVSWDTLAEPGLSSMYVRNLTNVYFLPLVYALQQLTVDDIGQAALQSGLQRIEIRNDSDNFDSSLMATLVDGVLTIDHAPNSNVEYVNERVQSLISVLESNL